MRLEESKSEFPAPEFLCYWAFQETLNKYALAAKYTRNKLVLDAGSGVGYGAAYLQRASAKQVVAGDISPLAIKKGKEFFSKEGVEFLAL